MLGEARNSDSYVTSSPIEVLLLIQTLKDTPQVRPNVSESDPANWLLASDLFRRLRNRAASLERSLLPSATQQHDFSVCKFPGAAPGSSHA